MRKSSLIISARNSGDKAARTRQTANMLSMGLAQPGRPNILTMSAEGYMYDTQRTIPFYRQIAKGGLFRGENRHVLTTRRDGRIGFTFTANSWWPY
jgi:hypothetical protein